MERLCLKCGAKLAAPFKFCPGCAAAVPPEPEFVATPPTAEKAPVQGAFSGLLFGFIAAPVLLIVGTMLCLTGLGALLGIPFIIGGILAPLLGPLMGYGMLVKGKCPWCGSPVSSLSSAQSFSCDACNHRLALKNGTYIKAA